MNSNGETKIKNIMDSLRIDNGQIVVSNFNGYEFTVSPDLSEVTVKIVETKIKGEKERWTRFLKINDDVIGVKFGKNGVIALREKEGGILFLRPDSTYRYK